jgi:hypothetical protein
MKRCAFAMLIAAGMLVGSAAGEEPVYFADIILKQAVEGTLGTLDPTPTDMLRLTGLTCHGYELPSGEDISGGLTDLTGLEYATNLAWLDVSRNDVTSLSPLSGLVNLQHLSIEQIGRASCRERVSMFV